MFFEQYPILDALCTIGVFLAAWCLATIVMAFLGYCIHNGFWWTKPRRLDLNGTPAPRNVTWNFEAVARHEDEKAPAMPLAPPLEVDVDEKAPTMPPAPPLEVDGDEKALGSSARSSVPSLSSDRKPDPTEPFGQGG